MRNAPDDPAPCRLCGGAAFAPCLELRELAPEAASPTYRVEVCRTCGLPQSRASFPAPPPLLPDVVSHEEPHRDSAIALILSHARPRAAIDLRGETGFAQALATRGVPTARAEDGPRDLVVARRILEGLDDYATFFATVRGLCVENGYFFIEAADSAVAFAHGDATVLRRERAAYFTEATLLALLEREGFAAVAVARYETAGGTLAVLARRAPPRETGAPETTPPLAASAYGARVRADIALLDAALARARERGYETVLYGATRAAPPLLALGLGDRIAYVVDDAQALHGATIPGTDLRVYGPAKLHENAEPLICLLAAERREEARLRARLREELQRECVFVGLCAPGDPSGDIRRLAERLGPDLESA